MKTVLSSPPAQRDMLYRFDFYWQDANGGVHADVQYIAARYASLAILQFEALPLPGRVVGKVAWSTAVRRPLAA